MEQHRTRIDPVSGVLVVDGLRVDNAEVLRECRHWSEGQRGAPVELAELAEADLAAFAVQAVIVGATAMAGAAGVQERYGIESLVAEVEKRSTQAATSAAERTEAAVTQASTALRQSSEETKKAVVEAGLTAREAFTRSVETARIELTAQLTTLLGGEEPELAVCLQPVLERFGRAMEQRSAAQLDALVTKVAKQFDPADPSSPMAQQIRVLTETQAAHAVAAAEQQRLLADKLEALSTSVQVARASQAVLAKSTAKGATYEEQVHACLADIAAGLGDEYVQTGNVVGLRTRSKKGDGLLAVTGTDAALVVEMTDSPRTTWAAYLREAEDNRGAQASLGLVRTSDQLAGGPILTLGARRVVMAFDPEQDDGHLLRCVIQVLRMSAMAAAARVETGELTTADEHLTAALATLDRVGRIRKCAGQIRTHASTVDVEAESLQTELGRLLAQARTALAGAIPRSATMSPDLDLLWSELTLLAEHPERRGVAGGDLAVSHHAVLRYRQRVEGIPRVRARHRMAELAAAAEWEERPRAWMPVVLHPGTTCGYPTPRPDVYLLDRDGFIVTVLSERFLRLAGPSRQRLEVCG